MKKKSYLFKFIVTIVIAIALVIAIIFTVNKTKTSSYAAQNKIKTSNLEIQIPIAKQNSSKAINIEDFISQNEAEVITEKIERQDLQQYIGKTTH